MEITQEDRQMLKRQGFLSNSDRRHFSARVITGNGTLTADELRAIADVAERHGNGMVSLTTRLTVECPGIARDRVEPFQEELRAAGLEIGGTGPLVRPVVACKGTVCVYGSFDTQALAARIHERFYLGYRQVKLPHKFKIGVGGCQNNCIKPELNDFGLIGLRQKGGTKLRAVIGGRWGRKHRTADTLPDLYDEDEALDLIEKAILLFKDQGEPGERFAETIERIGLAACVEAFSDDRLLERKAEIIAKY